MNIPCVVVDHNAKTAIITRSGRKYLYMIPLKSGRLTVRKLTPLQFQAKGYESLDTDIHEAVSRFMRHSGGLTTAAEVELEAVKQQVLSEREPV
jgi:hypothetical protein